MRRADFVPTQATLAALASPDAEYAPPSPPWSFVVSTSLSLAGIVILVAIAATDVLVEDKEIAYTQPSDFSLSVAPKVGTAGAQTGPQVATRP